ncbi:hypothetical protein MLD52_00190 [Puniceicoccaceae bacterium K14]|nr:hypothetical protein [Puniceicoccaceae bacterium K14]
MARGLEKHKQREAALSLYGKDLARRSGRKCELCSSSGVALTIYELQPVPEEPVFENCIFICHDCCDQLVKPKTLQAEKWRGLKETIWSEERVVQVMAGRVLSYLSKDHAWAQEILEEAYLDEDVEEWMKRQLL